MNVTIAPCPITVPYTKLAPRKQSVKYVAIHCSATPPKMDIGVVELNYMHLRRGFACIGYHYVIRRNGIIEKGRPDEYIGAHVNGFNSVSVGVCMVGGSAANGKSEDNFTQEQWVSFKALVKDLKVKYPTAVFKGHRDFSPDLNHDGVISRQEWIKDCPCFNVATKLKSM